MGDTALEPLGDLFGRDAHQPEMRDVDRRFHIGKADRVEEALHRLRRLVGHALPDPLQGKLRLADHDMLEELPGLGDPAELGERGA
ncbi:MAG: hypothetical protein J0I18_19175, partial [Actinobacteria bacterium]|nr:hypothetical protein [Actinomycetota bacterium]